MASHHKGAPAQQQGLFFRDESEFYPLPSVVRMSAPVGQTPIVWEWWTRDHLSAIAAIAPEGQRYCHTQYHAIDSADVVAFLGHLRRKVCGQMVIIGDDAPIHRRHRIQKFLAYGAAPRRHLERLSTYVPELNPGEGLWQQLKGVELRHVCGSPLPPRRVELRDAVTQVR